MNRWHLLEWCHQGFDASVVPVTRCRVSIFTNFGTLNTILHTWVLGETTIFQGMIWNIQLKQAFYSACRGGGGGGGPGNG